MLFSIRPINTRFQGVPLSRKPPSALANALSTRCRLIGFRRIQFNISQHELFDHRQRLSDALYCPCFKRIVRPSSVRSQEFSRCGIPDQFGQGISGMARSQRRYEIPFARGQLVQKGVVQFHAVGSQLFGYLDCFGHAQNLPAFACIICPSSICCQECLCCPIADQLFHNRSRTIALLCQPSRAGALAALQNCQAHPRSSIVKSEIEFSALEFQAVHYL